MAHSRSEGLSPSGFAGNSQVVSNRGNEYQGQPLVRDSGIVGSREPVEYAQSTPVPMKSAGGDYKGR